MTRNPWQMTDPIDRSPLSMSEKRRIASLIVHNYGKDAEAPEVLAHQFRCGCGELAQELRRLVQRVSRTDVQDIRELLVKEHVQFRLDYANDHLPQLVAFLLLREKASLN